MKIKNGFLLSEIDGTGIVVATGKLSKSFDAMITLNSTGIFLWNKLQSSISLQDLIFELMHEYNIDKDLATKDVNEFINNLKGADIIDE